MTLSYGRKSLGEWWCQAVDGEAGGGTDLRKEVGIKNSLGNTEFEILLEML